MRKELTVKYIAEDGSVFDNEKTCLDYEQEQKRKHTEAVQQAMCDLDDLLWNRYYPNDTTVDTSKRKLYTASSWLKADIEHILLDESVNATEADIVSTIVENKYGTEILGKYIDLGQIRANVEIRSDFYLAFSKVKDGSDLASDIDYSLSKRDLCQLAKLHKSNKCRRKIEELLTACNFHYECGKFINKEYAEFLEGGVNA